MKLSNKKGFTLIEILVVIAIIAILAAVVFVALNPVQRFADARNSRRTTDVNNILTAVHEYIVDNDGALPPSMTADGNTYEIGDGTTAATCTGAEPVTIALGSDLSDYLAEVPSDPQNTATGTTGYAVTAQSNGIITVLSCDAEGTTISVSR